MKLKQIEWITKIRAVYVNSQGYRSAFTFNIRCQRKDFNGTCMIDNGFVNDHITIEDTELKFSECMCELEKSYEDEYEIQYNLNMTQMTSFDKALYQMGIIDSEGKEK
jgi:hypothetical protein